MAPKSTLKNGDISDDSDEEIDRLLKLDKNRKNRNYVSLDDLLLEYNVLKLCGKQKYVRCLDQLYIRLKQAEEKKSIPTRRKMQKDKKAAFENANNIPWQWDKKDNLKEVRKIIVELFIPQQSLREKKMHEDDTSYLEDLWDFLTCGINCCDFDLRSCMGKFAQYALTMLIYFALFYGGFLLLMRYAMYGDMMAVFTGVGKTTPHKKVVTRDKMEM